MREKIGAETSDSFQNFPYIPNDELSSLWQKYRGGAPLTCTKCHEKIALTVDSALHIYRFVCTSCGLASAWFEPLSGNFDTVENSDSPITKTDI